jgi:phosphoserine aminotransferase
MSTRPFNFSAGPAVLPEAVLQQAAAEMLNWHGSGMGVMEMSHRGKEFIHIYEQAEADFRELMAIPSEFKILFMQGGGLAENAIVPMNLSRGLAADFVVTGGWSQKSAQEAGKYCQARVAASNQANGHTSLPAPSSWRLNADAQYVHICSNETIHGLEFHELPDLQALGCRAPLVIDFSSHVASRPVDWSKVGLAFAGAQKNLGPAGVTLVVVREDLLGHALDICPSAFDYRLVAQHASMYNTPPTFGIYIAGLTFQWLKQQTEVTAEGVALHGVAAMQARNVAKAELFYNYLDRSSVFESRVAPSARSRMNVPFFLKPELEAQRGPALYEKLLSGAKAAGLLQLKGHKSLGGLRASLYNAMPLAGVQALIAYLQAFEKTGL